MFWLGVSMRYVIFALMLSLSGAAHSADMQPVGTAEAEARAERLAIEASREEAKRKAVVEEAKRLAQDEAQRRAAEESARIALEAAERQAAEEAERLAKQEAERKAAEEVERLAKQEAERKAAVDQAAQAAQGATESRVVQLSAMTAQCAIPTSIRNPDAAKAIAERARADAENHAAASQQLTLVAQDSIASLVSAYALDRGSVSRAYFSALCQRLYEAGRSPFSIDAFLAQLAGLLDIAYPATGGGEAAAFAEPAAPAAPIAGTEASAAPDAVQDAEDPAPAQDSAARDAAISGSQGEPEVAAAAQAESAAPEEPQPQEQLPAADPASVAEASPPAATASDEPPAQVEQEAQLGAPGMRRASPAVAEGTIGDEQCRALGVLGNCPDLNAVLDRLLEKPLEYNHPKEMMLGKTTEIALVLRTDWEGKDLPNDVSDELKSLPGEVKQGLTKITQIMSAELSGRTFDISPSGRQEQTIVPPQPASWNWKVKPTETGKGQTLKLRLYAHIQGDQGAMPPVLIKTLDASIDVDVTTWDWFLAQAQTLEPIYAIIAAVLGLITATITFILARRRRAADMARIYPEAGGYFDVPNSYETQIRKPQGPVLGDLSQSASDQRTLIAPPGNVESATQAAPPAPAAPPPAANDDARQAAPGEDGAEPREKPGDGFEPKKD